MNRPGCRFRSSFRFLAAACIALVPLIIAGPVSAADGPHPAPDGVRPSKIIWVDVADHGQLMWLMDELGATPLACVPGPGVQRFHVGPDQLDQIEAAQLRHGVVIDDAEAAFDAERQRIAAVNADRGAAWFDDYKTYAQINARIDDMEAAYPNLVTKLTAGTTHEGRTIYAMKITGAGTNKPGVLFNSCQHAREWISPMTTMFIANELVTRYATDPQVQAIMDEVEFFIVPIVNPDGYEYTWTTYRLWRKNRRANSNGTYGVDLNRNWDIFWNGGDSTSTNPSSDIYVGPAPFSEPEAQGLRDFFLAHPNIVASIDYHSYSQLVLEPWAHTLTPPPQNAEIEALGGAMSAAIQAVHGQFYQHGTAGEVLYAVDGSASDWMHDHGSFGYAIELRDTGFYGFELPPAQIVPTGEENFDAALVMADWASQQQALMIDHTPPALLEPDQPKVITVTAEPRFSGPVDPSSATLYTRITARGGFTAASMTHLGNNVFEATLPAAACGDTVEYYVQLDTQAGTSYTAPKDAPADVFAVAVLEQSIEIDDDFETDLGWTTEVLGATTGQWQRGVPIDDPSWTYDPVSDGDGSGQCWLTQNTPGNSDIDGGSVRLTSPVIDMTGGSVDDQWTVSYLYYLYLTNQDGSDRLLVEATDGDGTWIEVARHDTSAGTLWRTHSMSGADLTGAGLTLTADMQFRFTANDSGGASIVEAGLDGFAVTRLGCSDAIPGDLVAPFGTVDVFDLFELLANWGTDGPGADLAAPNDVVDVFDLFILLGNWG